VVSEPKSAERALSSTSERPGNRGLLAWQAWQVPTSGPLTGSMTHPPKIASSFRLKLLALLSASPSFQTLHSTPHLSPPIQPLTTKPNIALFRRQPSLYASDIRPFRPRTPSIPDSRSLQLLITILIPACAAPVPCTESRRKPSAVHDV
jgi:hypothetical protein